MTDYVVTRKRKRSAYIPQAIDPCLGYYLPSETAELDESPGVKDIKTHVDSTPAHKYRVQDVNVVSSGFEGEWKAETPEADAQTAENHSSQASTSPSLRSIAEWIEFVPSTRLDIVNQEAMSTVPNHCHDNPNDDMPGIPMLTVEGFLKRSAKHGSKLRHTYGKKGKRKLRTRKLDVEQGGQSGFSPATRGCHYDRVDVEKSENKIELRSRKVPRNPIKTSSLSTDHGVSSPVPISSGNSFSKRKKAKASKQKSLKQRIYEAAISTYGDPDTYFVGTSGDFSEQMPAPLKFVPAGTAGENPNKKRTRNYGRLVNPRKSMVNHDADFISRVRGPGFLFSSNRSPDKCGHTTKNKCAWNKDLDVPLIDFLGSRSIPEAQKSKSSVKKPKLKDDTYEKEQSDLLTCGPLTFIPMEEAEASYSALFAHKIVGKEAKRKYMQCDLFMEPAAIVKRTTADERQVIFETNTVSQICEVLSTERLSKQGATTITLDPIHLTPVPPSVSQAASAMILTLQQRSLTSSPILNEQAEASIMSFKRGSHSTPHTPVMKTKIRARTFSKVLDLSFDTRTSIDSNAHKPLGSFMEGMLETIRRVHEAELVTEDRSPHKQNKRNIKSDKLERPSTRPRTGNRGVPTARVMDKQITTATEDRLHIAEFPKDTPIRTPSPDIFELLQPSNYQIILI